MIDIELLNDEQIEIGDVDEWTPDKGPEPVQPGTYKARPTRLSNVDLYEGKDGHQTLVFSIDFTIAGGKFENRIVFGQRLSSKSAGNRNSSKVLDFLMAAGVPKAKLVGLSTKALAELVRNTVEQQPIVLIEVDWRAVDYKLKQISLMELTGTTDYESAKAVASENKALWNEVQNKEVAAYSKKNFTKRDDGTYDPSFVVEKTGNSVTATPYLRRIIGV